MVESWLDELLTNREITVPDSDSNNVEVALKLALRSLLNESGTYEDKIREVLLQGGDTDTNAAVLGGLIGAKLGYKSGGLKEEWTQALMSFSGDVDDEDSDFCNSNRDPRYVPAHHIDKLDDFYNCAPQKLEVICNGKHLKSLEEIQSEIFDKIG